MFCISAGPPYAKFASFLGSQRLFNNKDCVINIILVSALRDKYTKKYVKIPILVSFHINTFSYVLGEHKK